jgi:hypothetical protein
VQARRWACRYFPRNAGLSALVVDGDTATTGVTLVASTGGKMSYTADASPITLVEEDGRWKGCTQPDQQ